MAKKHFSVEQTKGKSSEEAIREIGISANTYYKWRQKYGGMKVEEAKRLKNLEQENLRLRRAVSDQALDIQILKEYNKVISSGKY